MNVTSMINKIKNLMDYSPEFVQYSFQLQSIINDAYYEVWTKKRWNFATKEDLLWLQTDIDSDSDTEHNAGASITCSVTRDERKVIFSNSIGRLGEVDIWEGQPIEINKQEYTISKVLSFSEVLLTTPYLGPTETGITNFIIKKRFYTMPEDCLETLYLGYRDAPMTGGLPVYGKSTGLMPRRDETLNLRVDYATEYAEAYIPTPASLVKPGEILSATVGAGSLSAGYYQFCYAFIKDGKIGALSEPIDVTVQENNSNIDLKFLGYDGNVIVADAYNSADQRPPQWEGYRKIIYFNYSIDRATGEELAEPCWIEVITGGLARNQQAYLNPIIVPDTSSTQTITYDNQLDNGSKRYIERDGQHQTVRFYPRPIGFDKKTVITNDITVYEKYMQHRYYKKPQDLLLGTDVPDMPIEFHQLIIYKALEYINLKVGQSGLAAQYEKKFDKEIKGLERRYVDKIDFHAQRGQFSLGAGRMIYDYRSLKWNG